MILLLILACAAWWDTHANVFDEFGDGAATTTAPGVPALFVVSWPDDQGSRAHTIHVLAVTPRISSAPPATSIRSVWCSRRWKDGAIVAGRGSLQTSCLDARPATGTALKVGHRSGEQLLLVVRRTQPGRVVVDGATVTYRTGLRFGRQHVGVVSTARFVRDGAGRPTRGPGGWVVTDDDGDVIDRCADIDDRD